MNDLIPQECWGVSDEITYITRLEFRSKKVAISKQKWMLKKGFKDSAFFIDILYHHSRLLKNINKFIKVESGELVEQVLCNLSESIDGHKRYYQEEIPVVIEYTKVIVKSSIIAYLDLISLNLARDLCKKEFEITKNVDSFDEFLEKKIQRLLNLDLCAFVDEINKQTMSKMEIKDTK